MTTTFDPPIDIRLGATLTLRVRQMWNFPDTLVAIVLHPKTLVTYVFCTAPIANCRISGDSFWMEGTAFEIKAIDIKALRSAFPAMRVYDQQVQA